MIKIQRQALVWDLFAIDVHCKMTQIVMSELIGIRINRAEKILVLYHGDEFVLEAVKLQRCQSTVTVSRWKMQKS
jgi:hypothetical protein